MCDAELHDLMVAVDVPPTRVDVQRAIADGRRRSRRRAIAGAAFAVLVVAGGAGVVTSRVNGDSPPAPIPAAPPSKAAPPPTGCAVETYAVPAGRTGGVINAIDDTGRYMVGALYTGTVAVPVRWQNGEPTPLAGATGTPVAVNSQGLVAGFTDNQQDQYQGWVWKDGRLTMLAKASGYKWTMPQGINNWGDVVGYAMGDALDVNTPVLWPADHPGTVVKLKLPSGVGAPGVHMSRATGIGDDRTIVGVAKGVPVRWNPAHAGSALPRPPGQNNGGYVNAIRGHYTFGVFYGKSAVSIVRWDNRTDTVTTLAADSGSMLSGTSAGGVVTWGDDHRPAARITPDGRVIPLNQPTGAPALALAVSADGSTIVGGTNGAASRPTVWHC